ncbi:hypothetical protein K470DRAFT_222032 [Piedraia hortae CBS 480.64]|uniref:Arrestin-like N-terminal domain-containing protein n=1 Tax=Piedraia hortae CBS 480.64 TaxID=1314780 RepID=A0A6A7BS71_9PEZI|nr:hypothetical protein K470DRAFT_222032 [Piedraia hortae CBS 480.64]
MPRFLALTHDKPTVSIELSSTKTIYTTSDQIQGNVVIYTPVALHVEDLRIDFIGATRTHVERGTTAVAVSGRTEAFHQFLKLSQPDISGHIPSDGILRAGTTHSVPFLFAIPEHLLPRACRHRVCHPSVRDAHLLLPPSLGGTGEDLAPEMASIKYGVYVKLTCCTIARVSEDGKREVQVSKARILRVMPRVEELPPLDTDGGGKDYTMSHVKTLRRGVLKGKWGTLTMRGSQPPAICLRPSIDKRHSTVATVDLQFDPHDELVSPPRLGSLHTRLKTITFFSSTARGDFPTKRIKETQDLTRGFHAESISLSHRWLAAVEWTRSEGRSYHARITVPVTLPVDKTFIPTFHSCLISRVYKLKLELGVQNMLGVNLTIKIPLQVTSVLAPSSPGGEPERLPVRAATPTPDYTEQPPQVDTPQAVDGNYVGEYFSTEEAWASLLGPNVLEDAPPGYNNTSTMLYVSVH